MTMGNAIPRQPDAKRRGRPRGGIREAARQLGLSEADVRRARKVASLSQEAQAVARETGLDNNRTALLAAAEEATLEGQVEVLRNWSNKVRLDERRWHDLVLAWDRAGQELQAIFLRHVGAAGRMK